MQKLLSLPPNLVGDFHRITHLDNSEWFVTSDPEGSKLGSGGGTAWIVGQWRDSKTETERNSRRIIVHAGGQSRRIPAYASSGKVLTPIPIFRWERGQQLRQTLLSLQMPLYERIMAQAPNSLTTLVASGDVYVRTDRPLAPIPEADVVCYGLWVDPQLATRHGVFVSKSSSPETLEMMLQKPSLETLGELSADHYFLMDIGIWLLSDRALELIESRSRDNNSPCGLKEYDMYTDFGGALGRSPRITDDEINSLSVAIVPLAGGEFYHYGTSRELVSSTAAVQNKVFDQRLLMQRRLKPNGTLFVQNCDINVVLSTDNDSVWVENAYVGSDWKLSKRNIITGVPKNNWALKLDEGICLDIEPVKTGGYVVRPYGYDDKFRGSLTDITTSFLNVPFANWADERNVDPSNVVGGIDDIQDAKIFPIVDDMSNDTFEILDWMISNPGNTRGAELWNKSKKLSANDIAEQADLRALFAQRDSFCRESVKKMAQNYEKSVFYQLDLDNLAEVYNEFNLEAPGSLDPTAPTMKRIHNHMLRSRIASYRNDKHSMAADEKKAFEILREAMLANIKNAPVAPSCDVRKDQIVWGRSPVRVDLAGGWTDTPPYSLLNGGRVVNMSVDLNGQQPIQVYIKPSERPEIVLRSIDMGASETVATYDELRKYNTVGSPFSIPKAALALAGFLPEYSTASPSSLKQKLSQIGGGVEITLMSAVPAGSGLGTSSILASTVLGTLSDFCGLGWDNTEICRRTLALEQLLTTGGGWQDQFGGVLQGVKLLDTTPGIIQQPSVNWLPEQIFTSPETRECHLLYYTGITRTAKNILGEIVRGMFLNSASHLGILEQIKEHATETADSILHNDFNRYGAMIAKSWQLNKSLDKGTNPEEVEAIIRRIDDLALGLKLPGAGGGGFLYIVAKDPEAAVRIRTLLQSTPPNPLARFVDISLSTTGFKVSRS